MNKKGKKKNRKGGFLPLCVPLLLKIGPATVNIERKARRLRCYYTETGNVNAIGGAAGVSGPFMAVLLLGNNTSQLLPNLSGGRARLFPLLPFVRTK